jgi:hypothetical protein
VAGISVFHSRAPQAVPPPSIASESRAELPNGLASVADARDDELLLGVDQALSEELPFRGLIPEEV